MKEYVIPEITIQRKVKISVIYGIVITLIGTAIIVIEQLYIGAEIEFAIFKGVCLMLSMIFLSYIGTKSTEIRLKNAKLTLAEDYLVWINYRGDDYNIKYSDIKSVRLHLNKYIVIKLKNSLRKVYIPNDINDSSNIFIYLQGKVNNQ